MDWRAKRAFKNAGCLFACILLIGIIWQLLEIKLYGHIQHRKVDDIINLLYVFAIYCAYWRGVNHGREDMWRSMYGNINGEYPDNLRDGSGDNGN